MKRILLSLRWRYEFGRSVISGANDYFSKNTSWETLSLNGEKGLTKNEIISMKADGVIGDDFFPETVEALSSMGLPFVDVVGSGARIRGYRVHFDDRRIGQMAARFLLRKGYHHIACLGYDEMDYSRMRMDGFEQELRQRGLNTSREITLFHPELTPLDDRRLISKLLKHPRPLAVFCVHDLLAARLLLAMRKHSLDIPGDLALLGVDNDHSLGMVSRMSLSSIDPGSWFVGWEAARLMEKILNGDAGIGTEVILPPLKVVERESTGLPISDNPHLAAFFREAEDSQGMKPLQEILKKIPLSRRSLERLTRDTCGCSPAEVLRLHKVAYARNLLGQENLSISQCAQRCGFNTPGEFTRFFQKMTQMTPSRFRQSAKHL